MFCWVNAERARKLRFLINNAMSGCCNCCEEFLQAERIRKQVSFHSCRHLNGVFNSTGHPHLSEK